MNSPRRPPARLTEPSIFRRALRRTPERALELHRLSLRFFDREMERRFQDNYFRDNLTYIRVAHLLGIAVWVVFGLLAQVVLTEDAATDLLLRYGFAVPSVVISLALTYASWYPRLWQPALSAAVLVSGVIWATHRALVSDALPDLGYAGLMVILAFNYVLTRLQWRYSAIVGALMIGYYNVVAIAVTHDEPIELLFADYFLIVFAAIGMVAAYGLERFTRLLFLRERELDRERERADDLLENTLPRAIVDRLKAHRASPSAEHIAEGHPEVTVLFADLVGFTSQAGRITPHDLVVTLDDVFTRFDILADRLRVEKIKTVGDSYMVVAGAPQARSDHAEAAAEMALGILDCLKDVRWPTGDPIDVRIGVASGPAVAGVIGRRKFAYDLWGDTVNLASRLEAGGRPGRILVSESAHFLLDGKYVFGDPKVVELKGKGPTQARFLLGRNDSAVPETTQQPRDLSRG